MFPILFPQKNDCPISIVEGEVDAKYKARVLGHKLCNSTAYTWATVHRMFVVQYSLPYVV
jgi:hypothetical protein